MRFHAGGITRNQILPAEEIAGRGFVRIIRQADTVIERTDMQALIEEECSNAQLVNISRIFIGSRIFNSIDAGGKTCQKRQADHGKNEPGRKCIP